LDGRTETKWCHAAFLVELEYCPAIDERKSVNSAIIDAIRAKRRLRFNYNGKERLVEPQCYGLGTKGTELLRAYQVRGGTQPEPLFDISKIANLVVLDEVFQKPGPNYKKNDSAMAQIFCQ